MDSQGRVLVSKLSSRHHLLDLNSMGIADNESLGGKHVSLVSGFANVRAFIWRFVNFSILKASIAIDLWIKKQLPVK